MTEASSLLHNVEIYTDGGCRPNPGPGAWAAIIRFANHERIISGQNATKTTNNRMELKAVIESLSNLTKPCDVTIYTDSQYVQQGITEWLPRWQKNNWRGSNRKPIKNQDLWKALNRVTSQYLVNWKWVAGHYGNLHNERVHKQVVAELSQLTILAGNVVTGE